MNWYMNVKKFKCFKSFIFSYFSLLTIRYERCLIRYYKKKMKLHYSTLAQMEKCPLFFFCSIPSNIRSYLLTKMERIAKQEANYMNIILSCAFDDDDDDNILDTKFLKIIYTLILGVDAHIGIDLRTVFLSLSIHILPCLCDTKMDYQIEYMYILCVLCTQYTSHHTMYMRVWACAARSKWQNQIPLNTFPAYSIKSVRERLRLKLLFY